MMRWTASAMLAMLVLTVPALAQKKGQDAKPKTNLEKLWRIEASGIGG